MRLVVLRPLSNPVRGARCRTWSTRSSGVGDRYDYGARGRRGHQARSWGAPARPLGHWDAGRTWCDMTITTSDSAYLRDEHVRKAGRARQLEDAVRRRRSSVDELSLSVAYRTLYTGQSYTEDNEALSIVVVEIMVR